MDGQGILKCEGICPLWLSSDAQPVHIQTQIWRLGKDSGFNLFCLYCFIRFKFLTTNFYVMAGFIGEHSSISRSAITSYTLIHFLSQADMLAFQTFGEENTQAHADNLKPNGMTKFYISRVFKKGDNFTIGNWLEYEGQEAYVSRDKSCLKTLKLLINGKRNGKDGGTF